MSVLNNTPKPIVPFLKWAGGKRWFTQSFSNRLPSAFNFYFEPFLGSGALLFHIGPRKAIVSDVNAELVETYIAISERPDLVTRHLRAHAKLHCREHYYAIRDSKPRSRFSRAARFIYLNRTCWNGLYRVNKSGRFNVPIGTKSSVILSTDNFLKTSEFLRRCEVICADFRDTLARAERGDFAFVDPPYTVKHNLNGFVKYNEKIFSWEDQLALRDCLLDADNRGVKFLMTNANHQSIRALYAGIFSVEALDRNSVLAASSRFRSTVSELIIQNY